MTSSPRGVVDVVALSPGDLAEYARVPIAFTVERVLDVRLVDAGLGGLLLTERVLAAPYTKDYDALDGGPPGWPARFDVSGWGLFAARVDRRTVGAAAVAFDAAGAVTLASRRDAAALWDLRVASDRRGRGVGSALVDAAERWAAPRGARRLEVETQNVNVPACRFYAARGFTLSAVDRDAYPTLPDETRLVWSKPLATADV